MISFKSDVNPNDLLMLKPQAWVLFDATARYCISRNLPFVVTSLITDRDGVKSKSNSHAEGRAFDIRVHGWSKFDCHHFAHYMNTTFSDIAAISSSDKKERAVVVKPDHMHVQSRPIANWREYYPTFD